MLVEEKVRRLEKLVTRLRIAVVTLGSFTVLSFVLGGTETKDVAEELTVRSIHIVRPDGKECATLEGGTYGSKLWMTGWDEKAQHQIRLEANATEARMSLRSDKDWGVVAQSDFQGGSISVEDKKGHVVFAAPKR